MQDKQAPASSLSSGINSLAKVCFAVLAWASLFALIWGALLGWFPNTSWAELLVAGIAFILVGIILSTPTNNPGKTVNADNPKVNLKILSDKDEPQ